VQHADVSDVDMICAVASIGYSKADIDDHKTLATYKRSEIAVLHLNHLHLPRNVSKRRRWWQCRQRASWRLGDACCGACCDGACHDETTETAGDQQDCLLPLPV